MGKLGCDCGNVISDVVFPSETEGRILRQQDMEYVFDGMAMAIRDFVASARDGRRQEWIETFFNAVYAKDVSEFEIISDVITSRPCTLRPQEHKSRSPWWAATGARAPAGTA